MTPQEQIAYLRRQVAVPHQMFAAIDAVCDLAERAAVWRADADRLAGQLNYVAGKMSKQGMDDYLEGVWPALDAHDRLVSDAGIE